MGKLTDKKIKTLEVGNHGDGGGLQLRIRKNGSRAWVFRWFQNGKSHEKGLGPYPLVPLRDARDKAFELRRRVFNGEDIKEKIAPPKTFSVWAFEYVEAQKHSWRNPKSEMEWTRHLRAINAAIGDKAPQDVNMVDVEKILRQFIEKPVSFERVRFKIDGILCSAGIISNPANSKLLRLKPIHHQVRHLGAGMDFTKIPELFEILINKGGMTHFCLALIILTACRASEATTMKWADVCLSKGIWKKPVTKNGSSHDVFLSDPALKILEKIRPWSQGEFVFDSGKEKPLHTNSILKVLKTTWGADFNVHGLRSCFKGFCINNKPQTPDFVSEMCLGHKIGGAVRSAYALTKCDDMRRELWDSWGSFLMGNHNI